MRTQLLLLLFALAGGFAIAQDSVGTNTEIDQKTYTLSGQVVGGYSRDLSDYTAQHGLTVNRDQFMAYAQLRWLPGNLLTGAVELGYLNLYSVKSEGGGTSVRSAVPLFLVFSMEPLPGLETSLGYGIAFLASTVSGAAGEANSSAVSTAVMGSLAYLFPIGQDMQLGAEARFTYMDLYDDKLLGIGAVFRYRLLTY